MSSFERMPNELIMHLLSTSFASDDDLLLLWAALRNVSHRLRALVDSYVRRKHLPHTHVCYLFGGASFNHCPPEQMLWYSFERISPNSPGLAVFADGEARGAPGLRDSLRSRLERPCRGGGQAHLVSVGRFVNDVPLPDFRVDWASLEISFDWRAMFTALLGAERLRQRRSRDWLRRHATGPPTPPEAPLDIPPTARTTISRLAMRVQAQRVGPDQSFRWVRRKRLEKLMEVAGSGWEDADEIAAELAGSRGISNT